MKQILTIILLYCVGFTLSAQYQKSPYHDSSRSFMNPIFSGDYPDPSILRDGVDYYVVHSSFEYYPGLTIWHSKDLVSWTPQMRYTSTLALYAPPRFSKA